MSRYLFLILALYLIADINVAAQEQNNPLLNRLLDKIQLLQEEVTDLRNRNELTQHQLKTFKKNLDAQLTELGSRIDILDTTPTTTIAPPLESAEITSADARIEQLTNKLRNLNQKINQINNRIHELARITEALQSRISETPDIEPQQAEEKSPLTEPQQSGASPQPETKITPIEPAKLPDQDEYTAYSQAMNALDRADYTRLRDKLTRFLQDYPAGDYADDANYWIAESHYAEGDLDSAESYFTQLIENYSSSEKREPALLKIAYIRLNNKQWEAARKILERLKTEAKDEQIRELAIEQLKQLENKGH